MCERWVGDRTDCYILTPSFSDYSSTSSSFCLAAQPGSWGPKPSIWSWFSLHGQLQLELNCNSNSNWLKPSVAPSYIIVWCPPDSCRRHICTEFNPSTGQGDIPISLTGYTCFLIDGSVEWSICYTLLLTGSQSYRNLIYLIR